MDAASIQKIVGTIDPKRVEDVTVALVDVPSPTGSEEAIARTVHQIFRDMRIDSVLQEFEPGRYNTIGRLVGARDGANLLFNGHMDISFAGNEDYLPDAPGYRPKAVVKDGWIHGMGVHNMKSGLAAFMCAAEAVRKSGVDLRGEIALVCVGGEIERHAVGHYHGAEFRGGGCGTKHFISNGGLADMAVVGEPTARRLVTEHVGSVGVRLTTRGKPAPLRVFDHGSNAIKKMEALLEVFDEFAAEYSKRHAYKNRRSTVHMHSIEGGWPYRCNRVPIFCHVFVEFRILPFQRVHDVPLEVNRLIEMARQINPEVDFDIECFVSLPSAHVPPDTLIAQEVRSAHKLINGRDVEEQIGLFYSDAGHFLAYDIPAVNYGPSGLTASGVENWDPDIGEHTSLEEIVKTARVYAAIMLEVGTKRRSGLNLSQLVAHPDHGEHQH